MNQGSNKGARIILIAAGVVAAIAGAVFGNVEHPDAVWFYGRPGITSHGGVEVQFGERGYGIEGWGQPGFFVDNGVQILYHLP